MLQMVCVLQLDVTCIRIPVGSIFHFNNCGLNQGLKILNSTVKPVLSDNIKQNNTYLAVQTGGCLLLHKSSEESMNFLHYFHTAISNHLSNAISMSP